MCCMHVRRQTTCTAVWRTPGALVSCAADFDTCHRSGDANFAMGKAKEALKDLRAAAKVAPRDPDLRKKLAECEKEVRAGAGAHAAQAGTRRRTHTFAALQTYVCACVLHCISCKSDAAVDGSTRHVTAALFATGLQVKRLRFEEALSGPDGGSAQVSASIELSAIVVEESYKGGDCTLLLFASCCATICGFFP